MVAAHRSPTYQPLLEKRAACRKRASATVDNVPWPATSSRMRPTNVRGVVARRLISTSWFLVCSSLRAVNSARISCAGNDLQCTGRNQPSRISWAMPRTSLRSVLTGIALPAKASALRSSLAVPARRCPSTPRAASSSSSPRRSATRTPAWPYRAASTALSASITPDRRARRHRADPRRRLYRARCRRRPPSCTKPQSACCSTGLS